MITYYDSYGEMHVLSDKKVYRYQGISPFLHDKVERYFRKGYVGKAWKILKSCKLLEHPYCSCGFDKALK